MEEAQEQAAIQADTLNLDQLITTLLEQREQITGQINMLVEWKRQKVMVLIPRPAEQEKHEGNDPK
jgi:hypothetical protein